MRDTAVCSINLDLVGFAQRKDKLGSWISSFQVMFMANESKTSPISHKVEIGIDAVPVPLMAPGELTLWM